MTRSPLPTPSDRIIVAARREVPVDRVMAEVGLAADEPSGERRPAVVEHSGVRPLPVHELRLLAPEAFAVRDRAAMEFAVAGHEPLLWLQGATSRDPSGPERSCPRGTRC